MSKTTITKPKLVKLSNSKTNPGYSIMKLSNNNISDMVNTCNKIVKTLSDNKINDLKHSMYGVVCIMMSYFVSIKKSILMMKSHNKSKTASDYTSKPTSKSKSKYKSKSKNSKDDIYTIYECEVYVSSFFDRGCHYANSLRYFTQVKEYTNSRYVRNIIPYDFYDSKEYQEYKAIMEDHISNSIKLNKDISSILRIFANFIYDYVKFILLFIKNELYEKENELKYFEIFIESRRILNLETYDIWIKSFIINFIHNNIKTDIKNNGS